MVLEPLPPCILAKACTAGRIEGKSGEEVDFRRRNGAGSKAKLMVPRIKEDRVRDRRHGTPSRAKPCLLD